MHEWWSTLVAREHRQVPDFLECERRSLVTTCRVESVCRTNVTENNNNKNKHKSKGKFSHGCRSSMRHFFFVHHLQPAGPTSNPACGHMTSPLTLQEVRYLSYILEQRGSTITRARRLLLLPVESVYPLILKSSISSQHQHNTLTTSKYGADRQRVKKHTILQRTGFEPPSIAI